MSEPHQDITRTTLTVLFIGGLIATSLWVMRPFLPAIVWATTLVIATWPVMLLVQRRTGNRRTIAVLIMTLVLLLGLIVPFWLATSMVLDNFDKISDWTRIALSLQMPPAPAWLAKVPLLGDDLTQAWGRFASAGVQELGTKLVPYAGDLTKWFAYALGGLGGMFVQFLLTIAIAAVMYSSGEQAAALVIRFGRRLGGDRGEMVIRLAGQAIRSVALGVVVTAVAQSLLGGVGLVVAGVPFATLLAALMFLLCLAQIGPGPVLIPTVVWMYFYGDTLRATILLIFALIAMAMDNVLRPVLIRRGANLPLLLILAGVVGGLIATGLVGIFLGPVVLAITYTLLNVWMAEDDEPKQSTKGATS